MMSISRGHKILWWMLNIFALSVPLSSFLSIRILVLTSVVGIFVSNTSQVLPKLARNSWDLILFIATLLIGLSYTDNLKVGFRVLETSFCFFALPLVFAFCAPLVKSRINSLSIMYLSGLVLGSLIMISGSFLSYSESLDLSKFTFYNLTDPLGFQPTYFAYYLSFDVRPTSQLDRPNCTVDLRVRFTAGRPDSNQSTNSNDQFEPFSTTVNCSASTTVRFGTFSILLSPSWVGGESPHAVINYTYTSRL